MHANSEINALLSALNHTSLPGIDLSLERMWHLLETLGNPQNHLPPVIHVAGTNAKGSTIAYLRAMFAASGLRVHSYTSPHLVRFNERILRAGHEIEDAPLRDALQRVVAAGVDCTFFEATTAAAFLIFSESPADLLLLEVGLGGRLDATNVVPSARATVITPIDFDHTEFLGESLAAIATEKAGILRANVPCIVGHQHAEVIPVLHQKASEIGCPLILHGRDWQYRTQSDCITVTLGNNTWSLPLPGLAGAHQHHNAALASVVAHASGCIHTRAAIGTTQWPARLQKLNSGPLVEVWGSDIFLDGGHNAHAALALANWAAATPVAMILGMMKRKNATAFLEPLAPHIQALVAVPIPGEDCHVPEELAQIATQAGIARCSTAVDCLAAARLLQDCKPSPLLICGSLFLAGEILKNHG